MAAWVGLVIKTEDRWTAQGDGVGMIFRGHWLKACVVGMGVVQVCQSPRDCKTKEVKIEESMLEGHSALGVAVSHIDPLNIQYSDDTHEWCGYVTVTPRTCCALCIAVCIGRAGAGKESLCRGRPADCSTTSAPVLLMKLLCRHSLCCSEPHIISVILIMSTWRLWFSANHSWDVLGVREVSLITDSNAPLSFLCPFEGLINA